MKEKPANISQISQGSIFVASYMSFSFKNYAWNFIAVFCATLYVLLQAQHLITSSF